MRRRQTRSRTGWLRRGASGLVALCLLPGLVACAPDPTGFPRRLEAALATGDPAQVEPLLSRASRPLYRALAATSLPDHAYFTPKAVQVPTRVLAVQPGEASVVLTVQAGPVQRDWVLVAEDGDLRLDLMATSARRPWTLP